MANSVPGNDDKAPVVYVPGIDGTGRLLYRQPQLQERYCVRCVAYPQDTKHTYDDLADLVIAAIEPEKRTTLLAESFGGAVALIAALRRPKLVQRLVLVNTFAYFPRRLYIEVLARVGPFLPARPSSPITRGLRGLIFFSPEIDDADRQEWWRRTADVPMSAFGRRFELIAGLDLRSRLRELTMPALILAAPDDHVVPSAAGKTLERLLPNAKLICPRVGHTALIHPQVNIAALLREPSYWRDVNAPAIAAGEAGSR